MRRQVRLLISCSLALIWGMAQFFVLSQPTTHLLYAQDAVEPALPFLNITSIDTASFPSVAVSIYGENLGADLDQLTVTLREDKQDRATNAGQIEAVGIQTAFVLDAPSNIRDPGLIDGRARFEEYQYAIDILLDRNMLSAETDWLAAFATGVTNDDFRIIADWTQDHGALRNDVLRYTPADDTASTPLFDLIEFTLGQFQDSGAPPNVMKSIVVFSDGFDATSDLDQKDIIRQAQEMNVRIYTVLVGPPDAQRQSNMTRIAQLTNGQFVLLDASAALDPIWFALEQQRKQFVINYRANRAQPQEVEITALVPDAQPLVRRADFPVVSIQSVHIQVLEPANGSLTREAATHDTPLIEIEPLMLPIRLQFTWPDGKPRMLQRVEYTLNDDTRVVENEPLNRFDFPIANLPMGRYTLRVVAYDELGLAGRSNPLPVAINIVMPPVSTPPPTLTPMPTAAALPTPIPTPALAVNPDVGTLLRATLLLLLALGILVWLGIRAWQRRDDDQSIPPEFILDEPGPAAPGNWRDAPAPQHYTVMDDATEIPAEPPFNPVPAARLVGVDETAHLPSPIVLHIGSVVRIGRRADLCDVVLDDKRISRAHAIITHREKGFYIQDDGSKGGTYVNQRRLSVSDDRLLKHGDIIHLHAIVYRFEDVDESEHTEIPEDLFTDADLPVTPINGLGIAGSEMSRN